MSYSKTIYIVLVILFLTGINKAQELELVGSITTPGIAYGVSVLDDYAYVADSSAMLIIDISNPSQPVIINSITINNRIKDVFVKGDYAYIAEDDIGSLWIINISNPDTPFVESIYLTENRIYNVYVVDDYAYIADGYAGIKTIDISDPTNPTLAGWYNTPSSASGVYVLDNNAYVADYDITLLVFDVENPSDIILTGNCTIPGFARKGIHVKDHYAYVCNWNSGLQIIDINDPYNPTPVSSYSTPGYAWDVIIKGNYAIIGDYAYGLQIINISNPLEPEFIASCDDIGSARGVDATDEYIYVVNMNSLLVFAFSSNDLELDIDDVMGVQGQAIEVPIYANHFDEEEIAGVELHINYDESCINYSDISSIYLTDALINVEDNQIHILWEDYQNPLNLPDSAVILTLQFVIAGEAGEICALNWQDSCEIVNPYGEIIAGISYFEGNVSSVVFSDISGHIVYYDMIKDIAGVAVSLNGETADSITTDENGIFSFSDLSPGNYSLCPIKEDNDSGVTVSDIISIRRHIVYLDQFDSPYKYIASDVNQSGTVSVADIILLRRYLAQLDELPSGNWAFVDSSFEISNANWMEAPQCIDTTLLYENLADINFIGIRKGDVDNSWGTDGYRYNITTDLVEIEIHNACGCPGDTVTLSLIANGIIDVAGVELHFEYPAVGLNFIAINSDILEDATANGNNGAIHLVWDDIFNMISLADGEQIASIDFEIQEQAVDSMAVSFIGVYVVDEFGDAFLLETTDGYVLLEPTFIASDDNFVPGVFILHQNYPNPFNAITVIRYNLPEASDVSLEVYDLLGRKIEAFFYQEQPAGPHQVAWNAVDVPSGIYFYKIQVGDYKQTKKMLLLR